MGALVVVSVASAYGFLRYHRDLRAVHWLDVAWPPRWQNVRRAQGIQLVVTGFSLGQQGKRREGLMYLRRGIAHVPEHRAGRLLLASVLGEAQRHADARAILLGGLHYHRADPHYVAAVARFLLEHQEDDALIQLAREWLDESPMAFERNGIAALAAATACYHRGRYDQTDELLARVPRLAASPGAILLASQADWERGYRELSLLRLRALAAEYPHDDAVHGEYLTRLRQSGKHDEVRRHSLSRHLARPAAPAPRIELLHAYHHDNDRERLAREIDAILREPAVEPGTLLAVADFAAVTGDPTLCARLLAHARANGLPWAAHAFLRVEGLIVAEDYRGALDAIRQLHRDESAVAEQYAVLVDSFHAVAYLGLGERENARIFLTKFLDRPFLRADNLMALANRFLALGAPDDAHRILLRATAADPLNQAALTRLVELDLNHDRVDELPAHLRRLVTMRKPSLDVLRVAEHKLGSDLFLYSADRDAALDAVRVALDHAASGRTRH